MSTIVRACGPSRGANVVRVAAPGRRGWRLVYTLPLGYVHCMLVWNGYLYVGTGPSGRIYRSADGKTWEEAAQLPSVYEVQSLCGLGGHLYAGAYCPSYTGKVFRSANGTSWEEVYEFPQEEYGKIYEPRALAVFGGYLYAGGRTWGHVYRSSDGASWSYAGEAGSIEPIYHFAVFGSHLYCGKWGDWHRSSDGTTWDPIWGEPGGLGGAVEFDGQLYAGGPILIGRSPDGLNWATVETGVSNVMAMGATASAVYCIDAWGIWRSGNGEFWRRESDINIPGGVDTQAAFQEFGGFLYVGNSQSRLIHRRG